MIPFLKSSASFKERGLALYSLRLPQEPLVNTSILTSNKRIYLEAIAILYKMNTIIFNAGLCQFTEDRIITMLPSGSDLRLATNVITRVEVSWEPDSFKSAWGPIKGVQDKASAIAVAMGHGYLERIFPRLKSGTAKKCGKASPNVTIYLDGVGSVAILLNRRKEMKLRVQYKAMMQHWEKSMIDPIPISSNGLGAMSAYGMRSALMENPHDGFLRHITSTLTPDRIYTFPQGYPAFDEDSFEFWTCAEWTMHLDELQPESTYADDW